MISVIIPTKDREEQLISLIKSLDSQQILDITFEVIIINDGSQYSDSFKKWIIDRGVDIHYFEVMHKGPAAARNLGVSKAKGDIISFIDDDCIADENWISNIHFFFNKEENIDTIAVGGEVKPILEKGNSVNNYLSYIGFLNGAIRNNGKITNMTTANLSIRKDAFLDVQGFNETFRFSEDENLVWKLSQKGKLDFCDNISVCHNHNISLLHFLKKYICYGYGVKMHCTQSGEILDDTSPYWLYCNGKWDMLVKIRLIFQRAKNRVINGERFKLLETKTKLLFFFLSFLQEFAIQYGSIKRRQCHE